MENYFVFLNKIDDFECSTYETDNTFMEWYRSKHFLLWSGTWQKLHINHVSLCTFFAAHSRHCLYGIFFFTALKIFFYMSMRISLDNLPVGSLFDIIRFGSWTVWCRANISCILILYFPLRWISYYICTEKCTIHPVHSIVSTYLFYAKYYSRKITDQLDLLLSCSCRIRSTQFAL